MAQIIELRTRRPLAIPAPEHPRDFYRERPEGVGAAAVVIICAGLGFLLYTWALVAYLGPLVVR